MNKSINSLFIVILFTVIHQIKAQEAFHNFGDIQIHDDGKIGFHTDLINDGVFNSNLGLAGFYGEDQLTVSGTSIAEFYNSEIDVLDGLNLKTSMGVYNTLEFINGKVFTPRSDLDITLDFLQAIYRGESDYEHVDGYAALFGAIDFTFPIGDEDKLRPLSISKPNSLSTFKSAYFYEDPNSPTTFSTLFDTNSFAPILSKVNDKEYWDLDGDEAVEVTLTWDLDSDIKNLTDDIELLRVVGWNTKTLRWDSLGRNDVSGDLEEGDITSVSFVPDDYEVLTIAAEPAGNDFTINTGFSPNGDGLNDHFEITGLDLSQENSIEVYDRWGKLVYKTENYNNNWGGISENSLTIDKGIVVPVGTYFFILKLKDKVTNKYKTYRGWVYINY